MTFIYKRVLTDNRDTVIVTSAERCKVLLMDKDNFRCYQAQWERSYKMRHLALTTFFVVKFFVVNSNNIVK
jgi:hypothetical protein